MKIFLADTISCAHQLHLPYASKCNSLHGHNYGIMVEIHGETGSDGMVVDYAQVKSCVREFDHKSLNDFLEQPTAENFAELLAKRILEKVRQRKVDTIVVRVAETASTYAEAEAKA